MTDSGAIDCSVFWNTASKVCWSGKLCPPSLWVRAGDRKLLWGPSHQQIVSVVSPPVGVIDATNHRIAAVGEDVWGALDLLLAVLADK